MGDEEDVKEESVEIGRKLIVHAFDRDNAVDIDCELLGVLPMEAPSLLRMAAIVMERRLGIREVPS